MVHLQQAPRRVAQPLVLLGLLSLVSCVYDSDDLCGPDQVYVEDDDACRCEDGLVIAEDGDHCVPCGEHEEEEGGECVCEQGYARASAGASCEEEVEAVGLGDACDPDASGECEGEFDFCAEGDADGEGYCTASGCTADDDCAGGYACAEGSPSFCQRPPSGQGESCEADADCEGKAASFCEAILTKMCLVSECADSGGECFGSWACCDFSGLGFSSLCVPPDRLMDGACPLGVEMIGGEQ